MTALLPALLVGAAVVLLVGLPAPSRAVLRIEPRQPFRTPSEPVVALGVFVVLLVPLGPVGAAVAGIMAVIGKRALGARRRERLRAEERGSAAEAMAVLAAELRAGRSPARALAGAAEVAKGPASVALAEAAGASGFGAGTAEALYRHASSSAVADLLTGLAVCLQVCEGSGSSLATAVDQLEEALLDEAAVRDEVEAELAGPRATAVLLAFLPVMGLLLGAGLGGNPLHLLLHSVLGWGCLLVGIAFELAGLAWTNAIVRSARGGVA